MIDFVSTGHLPTNERTRELVVQAYERFRSNDEGENSQVYPALAAAPSSLFGISLSGTDGGAHSVGDSDYGFPIMSVSKPFVFALVCQELGAELLREKIGVDATGLPFDSAIAVERRGATNPMVNAGAIATTSLVPGTSRDEKWRFIHRGLSRFAGHTLELDEEVYASATRTNHRNQALARMLMSTGRIYADPSEATDLYTRQCSLAVSARDLAVMGATLASGGVQPFTDQEVVDASVCHYALAVMVTAGMYETSGTWLYEVGLPAKSGIGGGIVAVSPGKGALATFAPKLDSIGNSIKGQLVAKFLSRAALTPPRPRAADVSGQGVGRVALHAHGEARAGCACVPEALRPRAGRCRLPSVLRPIDAHQRSVRRRGHRPRRFAVRARLG
jgi:glutaminase